MDRRPADRPPPRRGGALPRTRAGRNSGALRCLDAWLAGLRLEDATLAGPRRAPRGDRARGAELDQRFTGAAVDPNQGGACDGTAGRGGGAGVSRLSLPCSPRAVLAICPRLQPTRFAGPVRPDEPSALLAQLALRVRRTGRASPA